MDPANIPHNALIVGPTNSGKSQFVMDQLLGPFRGKFVLICPTFAHNRTFHRMWENDLQMYVLMCEKNQVEVWLKLVSRYFEGTSTLVILDDCTPSKDAKGRTGQLVNLGFSTRHTGLTASRHHGFLPGEHGGARSLLHPLG